MHSSFIVNEQYEILNAKSLYDTASGMNLPCILAKTNDTLHLIILADPLASENTAILSISLDSRIFTPDSNNFLKNELLDGPVALIYSTDNAILIYQTFPGSRELVSVKLPWHPNQIIGCWSDIRQESIHFLIKQVSQDQTLIKRMVFNINELQDHYSVEPKSLDVMGVPDYMTDFVIHISVLPRMGKSEFVFAALTRLGTLVVFFRDKLDWTADLKNLRLDLPNSKCQIISRQYVIVLTSETVAIFSNGILSQVFSSFQACIIRNCSWSIVEIPKSNVEDAGLLQTKVYMHSIKQSSSTKVENNSINIPNSHIQTAIVNTLEMQIGLAKSIVADVSKQIEFKQGALRAGRRYISRIAGNLVTDPDQLIQPDQACMEIVLKNMVAVDPNTGMRLLTQPDFLLNENHKITPDPLIQITKCTATVDKNKYKAHIYITIQNTSNLTVYNVSFVIGKLSRYSETLTSNASVISLLESNSMCNVMCRVNIPVRDRVSDLRMAIVPIYSRTLDGILQYGYPITATTTQAQSSIELICTSTTSLLWTPTSSIGRSFDEVISIVGKILGCSVDISHQRATGDLYYIEFSLLNSATLSNTQLAKSIRDIKINIFALNDETVIDCVSKLVHEIPEIHL
ncbi:hypothetical protein BATDEDRAFT_28311 [Batrachochytrium dendrobatidis JAM81]|uniref:Uncharacterized protein n=1 Tax=Batrachochytrium dendrobatidis (strain JAM81 / FGSC 10211) TaxID=684364 RepID=F4PDN0_BATDJ|nr:uncharacterized protein BATDEDRAFT_28311 [Batrachochytrium dendrobatidis JAM81]EGF76810.1 hypothetical protein BATDEDRAFT_28311 [Batrachochytrium dendrobatidis JAM81]|eukprot:XP_006682623.1 hypothetical protein BATDEDRAFT_28311 [Batrachochytrium dendrobatidis JAM81]